MKIIVTFFILIVFFDAYCLNFNLQVEKNALEEIIKKYGIHHYAFNEAKCSFTNSSLTQMVDKLSDLIKSSDIQCENDAQFLFSDLERKLDQMSGVLAIHEGELYDQYDYENYEQFEKQYDKIEQQSFYLLQISKIMSSMSELSVTGKCGKIFSKDTILPMISELMVNASALGARLPTSAGLAFSYSTMATGTLLNTLNYLLDSRIDWYERENRKKFLEFNCSFYELRKQLYLKSQLRPYSHFSQEQLKNDQMEVKEIAAKVESYYFNAQKDRFGEHVAELVLFIKKNQNFQFDTLKLSEFTPRMMQLQDAVLGVLNNLPQDNNEVYQYRLTSDLDKLQQQFESFYKSGNLWLADYNSEDSMRELMSTHIQTLGWVIDEFDFDDDELKKLNYMLIQSDMYIVGQLNLPQVNKDFYHLKSSSDLFDLVSEYQTLSQLIYGKNGRSFAKHLLDEASLSIKQFEKYFAKIEKSKESSCGDLQKAESSWTSAYTATMEVQAFVDLNHDLILSSLPQKLSQKYLSGLVVEVPEKENKLKQLVQKVKHMKNKHNQILNKLSNQKCFL